SLSGGKIHIPRQRWRHCSSNTAPAFVDKPCDSVNGTIAARFRFRGSDAGSRAQQNFFTGQIWQRGLCAVQTRAPRSIIAFWKSRALFWGTSFAESFHNFCRPWVESIGARILKRRVRTRAVLASTMGRDLLRAKTVMAFAVYRPIPGKDCNASGPFGNFPPNFPKMVLAQR